MSSCDLDLWSVDLESSRDIKRRAIKVCTKLERYRTIPGWIIDNFAFSAHVTSAAEVRRRSVRWRRPHLSRTQIRHFRRCSTPPPDWYIDLLGMSKSHRCCETFTGCGLRNASISSWLCSFTDACMVWSHDIFPTTSSASPIPTAAVSGRRHLRSWWSDVHGCPLSAIVHFQWLEAASGTVCRPTSPQRSLFFKTVWKRTSFPEHFLPNCFRFSVLYIARSSGLAVLYLGHSK